MSSYADRNIDVRGGSVHFVGHQVNINGEGEDNMTLSALRDASATDAPFNSQSASACLQDTRVAVMEQIRKYMDAEDHPVCLLYGMAGVGKSFVAQSMAEYFDGEDLLAASFIFSRRIAGRNDTKHFITTIAYQLTITVPEAKPHILSAIQCDHSILHQTHQYQLQKLIIEPLAKIVNSSHPSKVVVVDGLDECSDGVLMSKLISRIIDAVRNCHLKLRFLFASRFELHIQKAFRSESASSITHLLPLHEFDAQEDIRAYFKDCFKDTNRLVMCRLPLPWPTHEDLEKLVARSGGLFIFASTLMKYIDDKNHNPIKRLADCLDSQPSSNSSSIHAGLDQLYHHILSMSSAKASLLKVLGALIFLSDPLSIVDVERLLQLDFGDGSLILEGLQSILMVPEDERPVLIFHESLREFLTNVHRSKEYFIEPTTQHADITHACLALILSKPSLGFDDFDHDLKPKDRALGYACDNWPRHLCMSTYCRLPSSINFRMLGNFCVNRLLDWIYFMSLREVSGLSDTLYLVIQWLDSLTSTESIEDLVELFREAKLFVDSNHPPQSDIVHPIWTWRSWMQFRSYEERPPTNDFDDNERNTLLHQLDLHVYAAFRHKAQHSAVSPFIQPTTFHANITHWCLTLILNKSSLGFDDVDVNLKSAVRGLGYAYDKWPRHLSLSSYDQFEVLEAFCLNRLLSWICIMSLQRNTELANSLGLVVRWLESVTSTDSVKDLIELFREAKLFVDSYNLPQCAIYCLTQWRLFRHRRLHETVLSPSSGIRNDNGKKTILHQLDLTVQSTCGRETEGYLPLASLPSANLPDLTGKLVRENDWPFAWTGHVSIWAGTWLNNNKKCKVAIRVIGLHDENEKIDMQWIKKVSVWGKLTHQNILPFLGVTFDFGPLALVSLWPEHGSLSDYLQERGRVALSLPDRFNILCNVADGLSYLHSCNTVHGNLSTANILIDGKGKAVVAGFPFSGHCGDVRYTAPEVLPTRESDCDHAFVFTTYSDIYSYGSIILETLSGKPPYYHLRGPSVLCAAILGRIRRPKGLADDHWALICRCWSDLPVARPDINGVSRCVQILYWECESEHWGE